MRERATLTLGFCALALVTATSPARAQELIGSFADAGTTAGIERPPLSRIDTERAEAEAWAATVERVPAPQLTTLPREITRAKPRITPAVRPPLGQSGHHALSGIASYYWQGTQTASGEPFNKRDMTAAHPSLPFGTKVRVFCANTGRQVVVRINDRGPFKPGRVIDLSEAAAEAIGMTGRGLTVVQLEVVRN